MKKNVIILGSSRSNGDTRSIINQFLENMEADVVDLKELEMSYFDYEHMNQNDDFIPLAERLTQYENIILATPVYWYTMSAIMKTFLDRWSDLLKIRKDIGRQFRGKNMFVIACSSDATAYPHFDEPFKLTADYMGMGYLGWMHTWVENGGEIPSKVKAMIEKKGKALKGMN